MASDDNKMTFREVTWKLIPVIPAIRKLRQEDYTFWASLNDKVSSRLA